MSFGRKTYEQSRASYKPMRRTPLRSKSALKRGKGLKRPSGLKPHRQSPKEKAWRIAVLERDGYRCRWVDARTDFRCSEVGVHVNAHHINERSQRPDLVADVDNGAALCPFHHSYAHHSVRGRKEAIAQKLLGGETYEAAQKRKGNQNVY